MVLSMGTGLVSLLSGIWGIWKRDKEYLVLSRQTLYLHFIIISFSLLSLTYLLVNADFSIAYVTNHVNNALPVFYRVTSIWAGQAGSMLFWNFLLILFSVIAVSHIQKEEPVLVPYIIVILMGISLFFCIMGNFSETSDPFRVFHAGERIMTSNDGRGLNPLLQHWAMVIHPPVLYFGYVSFAIPYAIAMASLMTGRINLKWTRLVRRWTLFSWFSLGAGIMLGSKWAYEELGWGGYWAWDAVENASLMPWLTGTAFLHSILVQEKRGMLKVWNMVLVTISFLMCIFGTFLTRSGVVNSVHAFANSTLGPFFVVFMLLIVLFSTYYIISRLSELKSDRPINSFLSREAGFLFNNVLFVVMLFTLVWGTMYPAFTEYFLKEKVSVTAIWFNKFMVPLGLLLMFLTGAGPLLAWRKTAAKTLFKNFKFPLSVLFIVFSGYIALRFFYFHYTSFEELKLMAGISFSLSAFVISGVVEEFLQTTRARISVTKESFLAGFLMIFFQNKRRYLGYAVHLGLAVMFVGFTGKAFTTETKLVLGKGEAESFQGYLIEVADYEQKSFPENKNAAPLYTSKVVHVNVYKDDHLINSGKTEIRSYPLYNLSTGKYDDVQDTSEPAIMSGLYEDVYVQFGGIDEGRIIIQVWINPLVNWVWAGFIGYTLVLVLLLVPFGEKRVIAFFGKKYNTSVVMQGS